MNAYSLDLRLKVLDAVDRGMPRKEVVRTFGISMPTLERYLRRRRQTRELAPKPSPRRTPSILATLEERGALWEQLQDKVDATLECDCELSVPKRGVKVSTMSRAMRKLGWTFKKSLGASERDEETRSAWRERVRLLDPRSLVFVDECSTNIAITRLYARAPKGGRAFGKAPRNWGKNMTLIASLSTEGVGAAMSVEGTTDAAAFETHVEHFLAPMLKAGQVVVMDNLQVHKSLSVKKLIEAREAEILFLPPYPPDFSPIEETFSKVKGILRRVGTRTREALLEATSDALSAVSRHGALG